MAIGVALYVAGLLWEIRVLGALSLVTVLAGLVFSVFGTRAARALAFPIAFLLFMIPFPFITDLAFRLQQVSVRWSSRLLEVAGLPVTSSGAEILLGNTTFTVGVVCSGINTLVALLALAAVYVHVLKGNAYHRIGIFLLAFPLAIGGNILRITSIIMVAHFASVQTATGWYHDISSPVFFLLEFVILILIARGMKSRINYDIFGSAP